MTSPSFSRVGDVATVISGPAFKSAQFGDDGEGIRLLRGENIEPGALRWVKTRTWPEQMLAGLEHLFVEMGDLILGMDRPVISTGLKLAEVRSSDIPALLVQRVARIRPTAIDNRYLYHWLSSPPFRRHIEGSATGTQLPHVTLASIKNFEVPRFEPETERHIVDLLDDNLSRLEAAERYLKSVTLRVTAMRAGILRAAMTGELSGGSGPPPTREDHLTLRRGLYPSSAKRGRPDPLGPADDDPTWPSHWSVLSLEEATHPIRTVSYGILKPGPNMTSGVPYVRVVNMRQDRIAVDNLHRTTPEIAKKYERSTLADGDVLVSIRGTYGRVAVVPAALEGANITQDTARLAFVGDVLPAFAAAYLRSPAAQNYMKRVARGVAVRGVNIGDLRQMPFPVPNLREQAAIVARIDELSSELQAANDAVVQASRRYGQLRGSLLVAAFSGRLTSNSANINRSKERNVV